MLEEQTVKEILEKGVEILRRWLDNPKVPDDRKVQVVAEMIKRRIPNAVEMDGSLVDQSQHQHITFVYKQTDGNRIPTASSAMPSLDKPEQV